MALCEYLANYLTTTYLSKGSEVEQKEEKAAAIPDDPFAGLAPAKKKNDDVFLQMGGGKKKGGSGGKKKEKKSKPSAAFKLSVDTFDQFALLNLTPPTSLADVEGSVAELREKKEWYTQQPRGSVPTAKEIQEKMKRQAQPRRGNGDDDDEEPGAAGGAGGESGDGQAEKGKKGKGKGKKKKDFVFEEGDFAPLGAGASVKKGGVGWGKVGGVEEE